MSTETNEVTQSRNVLSLEVHRALLDKDALTQAERNAAKAPIFREEDKAMLEDATKVETLRTAVARQEARKFNAGWDELNGTQITQATESLRELLSVQVVNLGRLAQRSVKEQKAGRNKRTGAHESANERTNAARVSVFSSMADTFARELCSLNKIMTADDPIATRLASFDKGRLFISLRNQVRAALKVGVDLQHLLSDGSGEYTLRTVSDVMKQERSIREQHAKKRAAQEARAQEGNGAADGQTLGDGEASDQTLRLSEGLPNMVNSQLHRLINQVSTIQYEKHAAAAKKADSNTAMVAYALSIACVMLEDISKDKMSAFKLAEIAQKSYLIRNREDKDAPAPTEEEQAANVAVAEEMPTDTGEDGEDLDAQLDAGQITEEEYNDAIAARAELDAESEEATEDGEPVELPTVNTDDGAEPTNAAVNQD